jgi:hypothetical protein
MTTEFESEFETYETSLSHDILALNLSIMSKKALYKIVLSNSYAQTKKNIRVFKYFRHLYYCLKFKKQFRKWLWEKVREPNAKKLYNPNYLIKNLGEDDLETVLNNWK